VPMSSIFCRVIQVPGNYVWGSGLNFALAAWATINLYRCFPGKGSYFPLAIGVNFGATKTAKLKLGRLVIRFSSVSTPHALILG